MPENGIILRGSNYTLRCSNNNTGIVAWYFRRPGYEQLRNLYNGYFFTGNFNTSYDIDKRKQGQYDLVIKSTRLDHAGMYKCQESGTLDFASAELVVLGKRHYILYKCVI